MASNAKYRHTREGGYPACGFAAIIYCTQSVRAKRIYKYRLSAVSQTPAFAGVAEGA